jgi:hypothetical protein
VTGLLVLALALLSNPLSAALQRSAAEPRVEVVLVGRCEQVEAPKRCSVRAQSDRAAGYHSYRGSLGETTLRMLRVGGRDHTHSSVLKPWPRCWIGEGQLPDELTGEVVTAGATLRDLARDLRGGTITRRGRTLTRVRGDERGTIVLDRRGRVKRGVFEDPDDGRFRMTVRYPRNPFTPVTPTPACTDQRVAELLSEAGR